MICPNINTKEWKMLVSQTGEDLANMAFVANDYNIPDVKTLTDIKKAIGFKPKTENFAGIGRKLRKYNAKNGTSHSFTKVKIYGNTFQLTLFPNYLPVNLEKQRQRLEVKNDNFRADAVAKEAFSEIYTPSPSEQQAGYFNEEGDFMPNEDIDFLIPTAKEEVKAVEGKRKSKIETAIREQRSNLKKAKNSENVEDYKKAIKNLEILKNSLEDPTYGTNRKILLADKIIAFEEVLDFGKSQLNEVESLMANSAIKFEDVQYAQRIINLWMKAGDFSTAPNMHIILDEDEFNTPEIRDKFRIHSAKAETLQSKLTQIQEKYFADFVRKHTSGDLTNEEIFGLMKDSSWISSMTLNVSRTNDPMLQAIFSAVQTANIQAQQEANELWKELDSLAKKFLKKSGNNYEILKQKTKDGKETGRMVHRFSPEFFDIRNNLIEGAFRQYDAKKGKFVKDPKAVQRYFNWVNKNTITFDSRILFSDEGLENGTMPDEFLYTRDPYTEEQKAAHIAELKSHLGEKGYEFYIERQEAKMKSFKVQREAIYEQIQSDHADLSKTEKDAFFEEWLKEHSPYWGLEMAENPNVRQRKDGSFYHPKGVKEFAEQVPRKFTEDNAKTEWYDPGFEKIEADEDLLNYHNFTMDTLNQMRYILPEHKRKMLGIGVLPTVKKSIMDIFSEKGVMMGITPFWDKLKELQTTTDLGTIVSADIDPKTGVIEKNINIPFIEDTEAKIRDLVKIKVIRYEQGGKIATNKEMIVFRKEARNELSKQKSWDITRILKAHTLTALAYKHKSFIEPQIKLAEQIFNQRNEAVLNKAGESKTKDGKPVSQEGLKNLKGSLEYFMDNQFYSTGGRKIEGVTKRKRYTSAENKTKKELEELIANETDEAKKEVLQKKLDSLGAFVTGSGVGDTFLKYMTLKGLGWNLFSGASNIGFGVISNLIQASDGREYSMAQLRKAYLLTTNSIGKNLTLNTWEGVNSNAAKIRTLMDNMDLLQTTNKELFDMTTKSSTNKLSRFGPYTIQERSEYLNYAPVMIATMMTFKATDPEGNAIDYWDAIGVDGQLKEGFTANDIDGKPFDQVKMIQKIKRIIEMNHGDYNNPLKVKATFTGRAMSQFRTWMFEGFANRFEAEKVDYALSYGMTKPYVRKGRYRSYTQGQLTTTGATVGTMFMPGIGTAVGAGLGYLGGKFFGMQTEENGWSDTLFTVKQLARKLMFQKTQFDERGFSKVDAANMRKNMTELYIMVTMIGTTLLLKALAGDDDKKENMFVINFLLNQATRMQTDIAFYTNPLEFEKLTKTALPLASLLEDANKWREDVQNLFDDNKKNDTFQSGSFKGDTKAIVHLGEALPGTAQGIRLYRVGTKVFD